MYAPFPRELRLPVSFRLRSSCDDDVAALDGTREVGQWQRHIGETHGDSGARQRLRPVAHLEMKMRLGGVARRAQQSNHLSRADAIAGADANAARLQMERQRILATAVIDRDEIADHRANAFSDPDRLVLLQPREIRR